MTTEVVYIKYKHYICKMEKEFIPYELALRMKAINFNESCLKMGMSDIDIINAERTDEGDYPKNSDLYSGWVSIPTFSQAFRWFRKEYPDLDFGVAKIHNGTNNYHYHINLEWEFFEGIYEEAELQCLTKLIEGVEKWS
jgi:hypothetical protein